MEKWKEIDGYEGIYEVSSHGRVRSVANGVERILSIRVTERGYARVSLQRNKVKWHPKVHRLVATAFIENKDGLLEVNHKDGNKLNNRSDNLEWSTRSAQMLHAFRVLGVPHARQRKQKAA